MNCNSCGKELRMQNDIVLEGAISSNIKWEYFSEKDGQSHKFVLCESCYDKIIGDFKIPIEIVEEVELI